MPSIDQITEWIRTKPEVSVPLAVVIAGGVLQLFGHILRNWAALAVERMKLRHEIATRLLADFHEQVQKVREAIDALSLGEALRTADDVWDMAGRLDRFSVAVDALMDRSLTLSLSFRGQPSEVILDATIPVMQARQAIGQEWEEWVNEHSRSKSEIEAKPALFGLSRDSHLDISASVATLCSAAYWASEERVRRPHVRAGRQTVTEFLESMQEWKTARSATNLGKLQESAKGPDD